MDIAPPTENSPDSVWDHDRFETEIVSAVRKHEIPLDRMPEYLDLSDGSIATISDRLLSETLADPKKRERASYGVLKSTDKVVYQDYFTVGEQTRVEAPILGSGKDILILHTHGIKDLPSSMPDFRRILMLPEDGGVQAVFVVTPSIRIAVVRTLETPTRTPDQVLKFIEERQAKVYEDMLERYSQQKRKLPFSLKGWLNKKPLRDIEYRTLAQVQWNHAIALSRSENLALYANTGTSGPNVYKRTLI